MAEAPWEPGAPSVRAMAPSAIPGAIIPIAVYYLVRHHVNGDAEALMLAGVPAAIWVLFQWVTHRRIDPIASIVLFGFVAGVLVSVALGGNAFVLKVRDSVFTFLFGVACLVSLRARRPVMFYVGKALSAGEDEQRQAAYDAMWDLPTVPGVFTVITVCWGLGLIFDAAGRVVLAVVLPTGPFLVAAGSLGGCVFGGLFVFTLAYSRRARRLGDAILVEEGLTFPSVPALADRTDQLISQTDT